MSRLNAQNLEMANAIIKRYPRARSALIPLLHLAQEQDGWVTPEAMEHVAELLDITPAEVLGTCSFYEMFKREPVGKYLVNVCTTVPCLMLGGPELLEHLESKLGVRAGATTDDGTFTLNEVECVAACTQAPCLLVNYRVFGPLTDADASQLVDDLNAGRLANQVPAHGTTTKVRQDTSVMRPATPLPKKARA